jgi:hypothetical protein
MGSIQANQMLLAQLMQDSQPQSGTPVMGMPGMNPTMAPPGMTPGPATGPKSGMLAQQIAAMMQSTKDEGSGYKQGATGRGGALANSMSRMAQQSVRDKGQRSLDDMLRQQSEAVTREEAEARSRAQASSDIARERQLLDAQTAQQNKIDAEDAKQQSIADRRAPAKQSESEIRKAYLDAAPTPEARIERENELDPGLRLQRRKYAESQAADKAALKKEADNANKSGNAAVRLIDKAIAHPGRQAATGGSAITNFMAWPGSDATNFLTVAKQLKGKNFLDAFESLKGGGTITEVEGMKAEEAQARLNEAQSEIEYYNALMEMRGVLTDDLGANNTNESALPFLNDQESYRALPSGSRYIDASDGLLYEKP